MAHGISYGTFLFKHPDIPAKCLLLGHSERWGATLACRCWKFLAHMNDVANFNALVDNWSYEFKDFNILANCLFYVYYKPGHSVFAGCAWEIPSCRGEPPTQVEILQLYGQTR